MERFYLKFVEDDARDVGFQYLDTIRKKVKTKVEDHINRYSTLYRYYNRLPGVAPERNEDQKKVHIFGSFTQKWQQAFITSGNTVAASTLEQVEAYMRNQASFADSEYENKKRNGTEHNERENQRSRGN